LNNYKLIIQYDGTRYAGWQSQQNAITIQDEISKSVSILVKHKINLIGSGRTDAGVHALGQVANFKSPENIDLQKFQYSLNALLPKDISVISVLPAGETFHSRFSAKKRTYLYLISKRKSPFYRMYSYLYNSNLDVNRLNTLSGVLYGEKDFTSFSKVNTEIENKVCTVYSAKWRTTKDLYLFFIEANRFLHGMVRTIMGTLLYSMKNDLVSSEIERIIMSKDRQEAADAAPAKGLFLYKVKY
jgi:tRNA pseudouridine38-40 synthase